MVGTWTKEISTNNKVWNLFDNMVATPTNIPNTSFSLNNWSPSFDVLLDAWDGEKNLAICYTHNTSTIGFDYSNLNIPAPQLKIKIWHQTTPAADLEFYISVQDVTGEDTPPAYNQNYTYMGRHNVSVDIGTKSFPKVWMGSSVGINSSGNYIIGSDVSGLNTEPVTKIITLDKSIKKIQIKTYCNKSDEEDLIWNLTLTNPKGEEILYFNQNNGGIASTWYEDPHISLFSYYISNMKHNNYKGGNIYNDRYYIIDIPSDFDGLGGIAYLPDTINSIPTSNTSPTLTSKLYNTIPSSYNILQDSDNFFSYDSTNMNIDVSNKLPLVKFSTEQFLLNSDYIDI